MTKISNSTADYAALSSPADYADSTDREQNRSGAKTSASSAKSAVQYLFSAVRAVNNGTNIGDVALPMSVLLGDTNGDGTVNSADIAQTKSQSGALVTNSNFREDVTVDGNLNSADIALVKSKSGTGLP